MICFLPVSRLYLCRGRSFIHLAVEGNDLPRPAVGVLGIEGFALIALSGIANERETVCTI